MKAKVEEMTTRKSAKERFHELTTEGIHVPSVSDTVNPLVPPVWFDREKFKRAQYLSLKFFVPLFVSKTIGAIFIAQVPCVAEPLLATGNCEDTSKVFRRTLSTLCRLKKWYECDPFDPKSEAHHSIAYVRKMHRTVGNWMRETDPHRKLEPGIWMNQYDMAVNLWSLISVAVLWPVECGLHPSVVTKADLDCFCHFWAVICHCLCVEDRFNICLYDYDECRQLSEIFWFKVYKPAIASGPPVSQKYGVDLAIGWMNGLKDGGFGPVFSWRPVARYWYKISEIPSWDDIRLQTVGDKLVYYLNLFVFTILMKFSIVHWIISWTARQLVDYNGKRRDELQNMVFSKYPSDKFPALCPFEDINKNKIYLKKYLDAAKY